MITLKDNGDQRAKSLSKMDSFGSTEFRVIKGSDEDNKCWVLVANDDLKISTFLGAADLREAATLKCQGVTRSQDGVFSLEDVVKIGWNKEDFRITL